MRALAIFVVLSASALAASAQSTCTCSGQQRLTGNALSTKLSGNTVCVAKSGGGWEAQEQHQTNGDLVDYKRGPGHAVDPTKKVGTWSIAANQVSYTYTGGAPISFSVCDAGGNAIGFCGNGGTAVTVSATVKTGQSSCP